nr:glycosyltransferase [uncultured Rhodopila sp.]
MTLTAESHFVSATLTGRISGLYDSALPATLPRVTFDGDHATAFDALLRHVQHSRVVVFADVGTGDLDAFFHLRLAQILTDRPPLRALSVVVLSPPDGRDLAGGFADRFRTAWPFEQCVFVTDRIDPAAFSRQLGLPVSDPDADDRPPEILRTGARAGQKIAAQLQIPWGRCGSTTAFENQIEDLVGAGFLTIRLFTSERYRRGPTLDARMEKVVAENSTHAGAHINVFAVPDGPPVFIETDDPAKHWASWLTLSASCRIRDGAVREAVSRADTVIANHINTVGAAIHLAPRAKLLLDVHDDRATSTRERLRAEGKSETDIEAVAAAAAEAQARVLALPDICTHVSTTELEGLKRHAQRSAIVLPRIYLPPAPPPPPAPARFDLLIVGDEHVFNIASLHWFLDEVWRPHLEPASVRVAVAGRAGQRLDSTLYRSPLLHLLGFVDDLETFRSWCKLTVVPDRAGTGISVKLLTTISAGHPLATTPIGLRGLDASIAAHLPAFDDPAALAADILGLVGDPGCLEQRRTRVMQAKDAVQRSSSSATLLRSIPSPSTPIGRRRMAGWSSLAAASIQPAKTPYNFALDVPFAMSGSEWDHQVLLDGWHEAEPWGRWTDGAEASLAIELPAPIAEPLRLELDIVPSEAEPPLAITVDGERFEAVQPKPGFNGWDLPPELTAGKSRLVVTLQVDDTVRPSLDGASPDDRILGIGLSAARMVSRQPDWCEVGRYMPIRADALPRNVLLAGWHAAEDWGCWSNGSTASLQLLFAEPLQGSLRLELNLTRPPSGGRLTVFVNHRALAAVEVTDGTNRWLLPQDLTNGRTRLLIDLSVTETFCPKTAGNGPDDRVLGVALRGLRVACFVPGICAVGRPLALAPPVDLDNVLLDGWHPAESWGTWTKASKATMKLAFGETLSGLFSLEIGFATRAVETTVLVSIGGFEVPPVRAAGGIAAWQLPAACTDGQRELVIGLEVADTFRPADIVQTADDRTLGIGVRSVALNRETAAIFPVGETVAVSSRAGDNGLLLEGWHPLEPWGCWTADADATMRLPLQVPLEGDFAFRINLVPPLLDTAVSLVVNGTALEPLDVVDGPNQWRLPRACTEGQAALSIVVHVDHPARPADIMQSKDDRLLGVGVRSLSLVAVP